MEKILRTIGEVRKFILDILFPRFCVGCGREEKYICGKCSVFISEASLICPICYNPSFTGERHLSCNKRYGLDGLASIWEYEGIIKELIYMIKLGGVTDAIAESIESFLKLAIEDTNRFYPFLSFLFSKNPYITYVPMYIKKERKRGFNQAEIIAKEIGKISNCKILPLLKKTVETKNQAGLDKEERLDNVKNSFLGINNNFGRIKNVILVNDIFTTGATMQECCRVLKKSGIENIWGFTLARTP